jgi:hypothetical protein
MVPIPRSTLPKHPIWASMVLLDGNVGLGTYLYSLSKYFHQKTEINPVDSFQIGLAILAIMEITVAFTP